MADQNGTDQPPTTNQTGAEVLIELEGLIKNHITNIDTRKSELKKLREMLTSALQNDETYRLHEEAAKKATKQKSATKSQIMKLGPNADLSQKVTSMAAEVKELDGALSDYLREFQRMSGTNEIEGDDGEVREIVYVAKLIKRASRLAHRS